MNSTEQALAEAEEALRRPFYQVGEAGAATRWARSAQILCMLRAGSVDAANIAAGSASAAARRVDLAEVTFGEATVQLAAANGDWQEMDSSADRTLQMAAQYFGESSSETLWLEALRAAANAALAAATSIEGLVALQRIRKSAQQSGVSNYMAADIEALEAWAYDRFGAQPCRNHNSYRLASRWDRVRRGDYWLCSGHCDGCDDVIVQRGCFGNCLHPCTPAQATPV
jgi:hypothetical protein